MEIPINYVKTTTNCRMCRRMVTEHWPNANEKRCIRRHIRQFVIEQNNSINYIIDWPLCKQVGRQFVNGDSKLDIVHNFRHLQIVWPMSSLFRHIGSSVEGTLTNHLE